ncbi:hypothetical protein BU16DRAFT_554111 [Lophium mytilinum]|uniref:Uncharacterized protein n=1 Tax=Lophium mytilinum TaxID=390894 RepID=A0A6A6RE85_9PEZI|nr:hypothetical protein BU16DRAFT_554111 [Lophium mytilinum]
MSELQGPATPKPRTPKPAPTVKHAKSKQLVQSNFSTPKPPPLCAPLLATPNRPYQAVNIATLLSNPNTEQTSRSAISSGFWRTGCGETHSNSRARRAIRRDGSGLAGYSVSFSFRLTFAGSLDIQWLEGASGAKIKYPRGKVNMCLAQDWIRLRFGPNNEKRAVATPTSPHISFSGVFV